MLQVMEQCTVAHFSGRPELVFDFSGITFPKDAPPAASAAVEAKPEGEAAASPSGDLTVEGATNVVIEAINALGATSIKDMGKVMADVKPKLTGRFDASKVGELVKKVLTAGPPFVPVAVPAAAAATPPASSATPAAAASTSSTGEVTVEEATAILVEVITAVGASSIKDMGKVMGEVRPKLAGRYDMGKLSELVKKTLTAGPPWGGGGAAAAAGTPASPTTAIASASTAAASNSSVAPTSNDGTSASTAAAPLTSDELTAAVREAVTRLGASGMKDMGRVMTDLRSGAMAGRVDPAKLSEAVKKVLSEPSGATAPVSAAPTATTVSSTTPPDVTIVPTSPQSSASAPPAAPLSEEDVSAAVSEAITRLGAISMRDMGRVMSDVKPGLADRGWSDMARLSEMVKKALSSSDTGGGGGGGAGAAGGGEAAAGTSNAVPPVAAAAPSESATTGGGPAISGAAESAAVEPAVAHAAPVASEPASAASSSPSSSESPVVPVATPDLPAASIPESMTSTGAGTEAPAAPAATSESPVVA